MTPRLQCLICLDSLLLNESAAVRCGHVFHLHCILQWFESCKTCPVCRKKATARDLVRQLFFEMEENKSFNLNSIDPFEMHNELCTALDNLEKAKRAAAEAKNEADARLAENHLLKEKLKNLESASRLNRQQIKHLESMLAKQLDMEEELQKCKKRLQAAAFYELLSNVKDEPITEIDKYIAGEGLEVKRFIALLRRQLRDAMKTIENQKEEIQENRKKISELQKKVAQCREKSQDEKISNLSNLDEHKNLNVALKKELASTMADPSQTIMNEALEEIIAFSPVHQSPDVGERKMFPASLIASAYRNRTENNALVEKINGTTPVRRSSIVKVAKNEFEAGIDDDMEEVFVPPAIRKCAATTTVPRRSLRKTLTVKRNQMMRNRELLNKRKSCVQNRKKKEAKCLLYHGIESDIITLD